MRNDLLPKVSVIIVNWNVADSLVACLESIHAAHYPNLEAIVIDNASQDDSIKKVSSFKTLKINLIKNAKNLGFPKAVNQGLKIATGDYILLLNPDTLVSKDFFEEAISFFTDHPTAAIMGPKLLDPDGTPQGSVFPEPSLGATIRDYWLGQTGKTSKYVPDETQPTIVNAISGACMFIPRTTLTAVGLFSEKVFMYFEDLDYCRRIRKHGMRVYFNPQIRVIHEHGRSSAQTSQTKYRNLLEVLIYPARKLLHLPDNLPSHQRYLVEAGIWYHGWVKQLLITLVIWTGQKLRPGKNQTTSVSG